MGHIQASPAQRQAFRRSTGNGVRYQVLCAVRQAVRNEAGLSCPGATVP